MAEQNTIRPQTLINKVATAFHVPKNVVTGMRALIVSDAHFDKTLTLSRTLPKYIKSLSSIIIRDKLNTVFVLGDMIQNDDDITMEKLQSIITAFELLPVPVYIIGGNHERSLLWDLKYNKQGSNVTIVYDLCICLTYPTQPPSRTPPRVFLAHDLKNNFQLQPEEGESFVATLKKEFVDLIHHEDYLVTGHTHKTINNEEERYASVGAYSEDLHRSSYAMLFAENGFHFQFVGK
ncbi:Ser/Thr protein phosphatase, putative [Trichomonas vaginalis G3]|uniref:Ser/Thr protein phosphatase, putative n=1 Tax=Trichomonas vaginalis (strain ATCC PRA-98 / G3) TaxID=412133 RepID=A2DBH5_TRIV3|nr:metallo-dependent phosphatases family [Trichomonas vaginalis G3]EAY22178.1 Ser/Thr protein phosphatase, putative [Trichomonas vaginalis G3]KAI5533364.1 metallo-dependent phosphatases family [Trichomonas vaginalis G3]|eukprot:XP_001583164.1 Ser/Thr protein phosphatase [Trichomonas vaginalis G3]